MKMLLVWVILPATACAGKCAVNFQSAPFIASSTHIGKAFDTSALADRLADWFFVEVFADYSSRTRKIRQAQERSSTAGTMSGRFQQSWHVLLCAFDQQQLNTSNPSALHKNRSRAYRDFDTDRRGSEHIHYLFHQDATVGQNQLDFGEHAPTLSRLQHLGIDGGLLL